ncbi:dirigent protein 22-like [Curcuma longa]|uniref:dirigent protein 22-like n=1 Tax=Curcuma longa TaxID=136217 RepID=UPI003D9DFF9D
MASSTFFFFYCYFLLVLAAAASPENYLHLRFFQHERTMGTPNATVVLSVNADNSGLATGFGNIVAYDNALRETTDLRAPIIGHSQGLGIGADRSGASGFTVFTMVFTGGKYNGSSLDIQGIFIAQPLLETVSERAIVGGTGRFRGARGYLHSKEILLTPQTLTGQLDAYIKF